jgi:SAM-dependent methyltransferase
MPDEVSPNQYHRQQARWAGSNEWPLANARYALGAASAQLNDPAPNGVRPSMSRRRWFLLAFGVGIMTALGRAATNRRCSDAIDPSQAVERIRVLYDRGASRYERAMDVLDRLLFADGRSWVSGRARGDVLELAAGSGRNFPYYGRETRLTAQDISPVMLGLARNRATTLGRDVVLQVGDAQALNFPDAHFDSVVCTLGLCTIPDERRAVREAWRVLRPGGRLLLLEHVRSPRLVVLIVQWLLDPLACLLASDHLLRDPLLIVVKTGFEIERVERHALGMIEYLAARKPIARRPSGEAR